jgi:hypothetical protein
LQLPQQQRCLAGYYADAFASDDPAAVRQFCLDNFDERNT